MKINLNANEVRAIDKLCYTLDDLAEQHGAFDLKPYDNGIVAIDPDVDGNCTIEINEKYIPIVCDTTSRLVSSGAVAKLIDAAKEFYKFADETLAAARDKIDQLLHHHIAYKVYIFDNGVRALMRTENNSVTIVSMYEITGDVIEDNNNLYAKLFSDMVLTNKYRIVEYHQEHDLFLDVEEADAKVIKKLNNDINRVFQF